MSTTLSSTYTETKGIRAPNFFNGRLLSAEDLTDEQAARRRELCRIGRATGYGIAFGLEVTGPLGGDTVTRPRVTVSAGLALNREGRAVELLAPVEVSLLEPTTDESTNSGDNREGGAFGNCGALPTSDYAAGRGVYLLTIAPADGREGTAPVSGLGNLTACCSDKSIVDGVRFRMTRLDVSSTDLLDARLRNRMAHRCFGSGDAALGRFATDPFGQVPERYGAIDQVRRGGKITDAEIPLALIAWANDGSTRSGTRWIDGWSVRRRIVRPSSSDRWQIGAISDRRAAEGEAMFEQFQAQVEGWSEGSPEVAKATDWFDYLPAAGVLPLGGTPVRAGFLDHTFFSGLTTRQMPLHIEGARLAWFLRMAQSFPPIQVGTDELIWTYVVRENQSAAQLGATVAPCLVFASGYLPNISDPRFNASHWQFANYHLNLDDNL